MSAKVVSKTSDKTVIRERVKFSRVESEPLLFTGFIGGIASMLFVAAPLNVYAGLDLGLSFLSAGGVTAGAVGGIFALMYAGSIESDVESHAPKDGKELKNLFVKTLSSVIFPAGQVINLGKGQVKADNGKGDFTKLSYSPAKQVREATHEVTTRVKFTPLGAYVEQEYVSEPLNVWDEAFKSTLSVHKFRESKDSQLGVKKNKIRIGSHY